MNVYIVLRGDDYEECSVSGVFASMEKAANEVEKKIPAQTRFSWITPFKKVDDSEDYKEYRQSIFLNNKWKNGTEFIKIIQEKIIK